MSKDSTQRPRPDSNRGPFDPKSDAVTDWPLRLTRSVDVVCLVVFHWLNQCALACASTASMFALNQTACQRKKTSPDENLCSSPVKPTTTPHTRLARALRSSLKITSASFARRFVLDGHGEAGICSNNGKL